MRLCIPSGLSAHTFQMDGSSRSPGLAHETSNESIWSSQCQGTAAAVRARVTCVLGRRVLLVLVNDDAIIYNEKFNDEIRGQVYICSTNNL